MAATAAVAVGAFASFDYCQSFDSAAVSVTVVAWPLLAPLVSTSGPRSNSSLVHPQSCLLFHSPLPIQAGRREYSSPPPFPTPDLYLPCRRNA